MSRINTNVSSLIAQKTLTRSNTQLQESLTRLSTGLRINAGKDDPAGLIASENLRRDITSINKAISNTERANQLIATSDSALGQISGLLNDIRGLVVEAANTGVLSEEQLAANQLQVDSSLEAIDRIAQVTTFQGRKLLDGSLDFQTAYTAGGTTVRDLSITQANLGSAGSLAVSVDITAAATQALITNNSLAGTTATQASGAVTLTNSSASITVAAVAGGAADAAVGNATDVTFQAASDIAHASGTVTLTNSSGSLSVSAVAGAAAQGAIGNTVDVTFQAASDIAQATGSYALTGGGFDLTAVAGGAADGAAGNALTIVIADVTGATSASYNSGTNTLTISVDDSGSNDTIQDIADAIDAEGTFATSSVTGGGSTYNTGDNGSTGSVTSGGSNGTTSATYGGTTITVNVGLGATLTSIASQINGLAAFNASAASGGGNAFDTADFGTVNNPLTGGSDGTTTASYNSGTNLITASVALNATVTQVATQINGLTDFNVTATTGGGNTFSTSDFGTVTNPLSGGAAATSGALAADLVVKISGLTGSEVFNFETGATIAQVVAAINLVSDSTGVQATNNAGLLEIESTGYGSAAFVDVDVISEGSGGTFEAALSDTRDTGTDIVATVNGTTANGSGNTLSINTASLDLSLTVNDGSSTDVTFNINGGGAIFQVGPNVVSNNQVRIGINSVNTASLGGIDGRLFELRSGNASDLSTDPGTAASIVDAAINKVTGLRGRLGAFQKTTLETNIASLTDTVTNLTDAESSIRDADFAQETAKLTRAQILVQSGTTVLQIANQNPQNVLALLRG
ncbi:MAG: flagellin [Pirellulaceae bacterium]|nr:flagellin [Pirellulaceae bacterium]